MSQSAKVKEPHELISLEEAVERVKTLEAALQNFAQVGVVMSNAKFNLAANSRPDEPAGGYWVNGIKTAIMKPADFMFFRAIEAYGAERAETEFCEAMEKRRAADAALVEGSEKTLQ